MPNLARRYHEQFPVVRPQCVSDDGSVPFGGIGSECQPSRARHFSVTAKGPSSITATDGRTQSTARRTSPRLPHPPTVDLLLAADIFHL